MDQRLRIDARHPAARQREKNDAVRVVHEGRFAPVTTRGYVVNGTGELDLKRAGHVRYGT